MTKTELPQGHRIVSLDAVVQGHSTKVWVVLGPLDPSRDDRDDFTQPEVSHRYVNKAALLAAIEDGSAWL